MDAIMRKVAVVGLVGLAVGVSLGAAADPIPLPSQSPAPLVDTHAYLYTMEAASQKPNPGVVFLVQEGRFDGASCLEGTPFPQNPSDLEAFFKSHCTMYPLTLGQEAVAKVYHQKKIDRYVLLDAVVTGVAALMSPPQPAMAMIMSSSAIFTLKDPAIIPFTFSWLQVLDGENPKSDSQRLTLNLISDATFKYPQLPDAPIEQ